MIDRRQQSIKHLGELYTVVVGISLTIAIERLVSHGSDSESVAAPSLFLFLAFLVTIIPFYHGAMRHLDDTYLVDDRPPTRSFALLLDFVLLLTHGILFVVLSLMLADPQRFLLLLVVILAIDIVWGFLAHVAFSPARQRKPESAWAWLNLSTVVALILIWRVDATTTHWQTSSVIDYAGVIFVVATIRTLVDYARNWKFYIPD